MEPTNIVQGIMTTYPQVTGLIDPQVQLVHARTAESDAQIRLAMLQEKTKLAEAEANAKAAHASTKAYEVKKGILDLIKLHPDKFDVLVKLLAKEQERQF